MHACALSGHLKGENNAVSDNDPYNGHRDIFPGNDDLIREDGKAGSGREVPRPLVEGGTALSRASYICPFNDGIECKEPARPQGNCMKCAWNTHLNIGERRLRKRFSDKVVGKLKTAPIVQTEK